MANQPSTSRGLPPYDRFQLALYHITKGDVETAFQAMADPHALSPAQQITLQQAVQTQMFGEEVEGPSITRALKRVISDPVVWFGFTLGSVFPFGKAATRRFMQEAENYDRVLGPISRRMAPGTEVLRDRAGRMTKLGRQLQAVESRIEAGREQVFATVGRAFREYEKVTGGPPTPEVAVRIQLALEQPWNPKSPAFTQWERLRKMTRTNIGVRPIALTPAESGIVKAIDQSRRKFKADVVDKLEKDTPLWKELQSRGILDEKGPGSVPVEFYAPRLLYVSPKRVRDGVTQALKEDRIEDAVALANPASPARIATYRQYIRSGLADSLPGSLKRRSYELLPTPEHLALVERHLVPGTIPELKKVLAGKYPSPDPEKMWGEYSLDATRVWPQYLDSMVRFEAWTVSGAGTAIGKELQKVSAQNPWLASYTSEVLIPTVRGRMTFQEFTKAQLWEGRKLQWIKTLQTSPVFKAPGAKKVADWLTDSLLGTGRLSTKAGVDATIAAYLYQSSLGGNIGSAFTNLMQTVTTTVPTIGVRATMEGIAKSIGRLTKWGRLRLAGMDADTAYQQVFKPYIEAGVHLNTDFGDIAFRRMIEESWQQASKYPHMSRALQTGQWALMLPFRSAETFNRMVAYEGGVSLARREGLKAADAARFGREIVEETQFLGGALTTPTGIVNLSTTNRMFMRFPLMLASFLRNAVARGEYGKIGTMLGATATVGDVGAGLGVDVTRGLISSGLPLPEDAEYNLFGALPLVPPVGQLAGGFAYGLFTGDWSYAKKSAPMLVPGGVGGARALSMVHPKTAQLLERRYADYDHPTPDGRIGLFKPNGQLIGYYTPLQMTMLAMGLQPGNVTEETQFARYLQKQRGIISQLRRQMVEGMATNDQSAVQSANEQFRRLYGRDLQLKASDIQALHDRRTILRMQILLKQIPPEVRPQFQEMAQAAIAERLGTTISMSQASPLGY